MAGVIEQVLSYFGESDVRCDALWDAVVRIIAALPPFGGTARVVMRRLDGNEAALLELLALKPLNYLPPLHREIAERLKQNGMLQRQGRKWCPTAVGLARVHKSIH